LTDAVSVRYDIGRGLTTIPRQVRFTEEGRHV
jgi:hypothetical protein